MKYIFALYIIIMSLLAIRDCRVHFRSKIGLWLYYFDKTALFNETRKSIGTKWTNLELSLSLIVWFSFQLTFYGICLFVGIVILNYLLVAASSILIIWLILKTIEKFEFTLSEDTIQIENIKYMTIHKIMTVVEMLFIIEVLYLG